MSTQPDKSDSNSTPIATELRRLRETLLLCFGVSVLLIGLNIDSVTCLLVGLLFLLPFLQQKLAQLLRLLHDAPLISALREAALAPKQKPRL